MKGKTVAILENRASLQMADLVRKHGGRPMCAPALAEIPDVDPAYLRQLLSEWSRTPPDIFVFQTGVGTKALFAATDALGLTPRLLQVLDGARVIVRGPKPTAALRARVVRIDASAADPYTTAQVLAELGESLRDQRVAVQRYGETNSKLEQTLVERGAIVIEIATYRWSLPADTAPLVNLIDALARGEIDLIAFTSAAQAANLFALAQQLGKRSSLEQSLSRTCVASIGPVCSAALVQFGVNVQVEANPPKLGPFISAINAKLSPP